MKKKTITLEEFAARAGNPTAAAAQAGVSLSTMTRWLSKKHRPQGNNAKALRELGVDA